MLYEKISFMSYGGVQVSFFFEQLARDIFFDNEVASRFILTQKLFQNEFRHAVWSYKFFTGRLA